MMSLKIKLRMSEPSSLIYLIIYRKEEDGVEIIWTNV